MKQWENRILCGDTLKVLKTFPDEFVDCVITSPPYYGLRDYGVEGQIGLEPTLEKYLERMLAITGELKRVLKATGTMWWNHGDAYFGSGKGAGDSNPDPKYTEKARSRNLPKAQGLQKSLMLQNYRLAQRMIAEQRWILRNIIIWHKPNCMPSSVKDRFTVDFEPVFFFTKSKKYWFEPQYEPHGPDQRMAGIRRAREYGYDGKGSYQDWYFNKRKGKDWTNKKETKDQRTFGQATRGIGERKPSLIYPLGRNKRCVWKIPTKPYPEAHFAVYPPALCEIPIKSGCPERGIVLDPFMGSCTTAVVARGLGRRYVGIELNPDYVKLAEQRLRNTKIA